MIEFIAQNMAPIMFFSLIIFMLLGYPVAFSLADTLFWTDILMEHAQFFVMLMPGNELAQPRAEAERFKATFAQQFDRARMAHIDRTNYEQLNRQTVELVKPFVAWKHRMGEAQARGRIRSLVWPDFFAHGPRG